MPTPFKISTEADYLKAHVTVIHSEHRVMRVAFHGVRQRFLAVVKKWLLTAGAGKT